MITINNYASGSSGNCYIVKNENTAILLECGVDADTLINNILYKSNNRMTLAQLDGCLISHKHSDHLGFGKYETIRKVNQYTKVYACQNVYDKYTFDGFIICDNLNFTIGTIRIKAIAVNHGKTPCYAFIFKDNESTIFWGTDFIGFKTLNLSKFQFTEIFIEVNYITEKLQALLEKSIEEEDTTKEYKFTRQLNTHMSLYNCITYFLKEWDLSKCKRITALHVSKEAGDVKVIKETIEKCIGIECFVADWKGGLI